MTLFKIKPSNNSDLTQCSKAQPMRTMSSSDSINKSNITSSSSHKRTHSSICEFYANKSVFITGATGFLGKALLEKLLWQYDDIKHIYILIRAKKDRSVEQRFKEQIATSPIFDRLKSKLAKSSAYGDDQKKDDGQHLLETLLANKVKCIVGDVSFPRLGIDDHDWQTLTEDDSLTIIFHLAATVKFNEPLRHAIRMNVGGVKSVIKLARNLKNLECLCHVSTAYVNADIIDGHQLIEERLYPVEEDPEKMLALVECIDDADAKLLESHYLKGKPNTYTYTKSLAEKLLAEDGYDLPIVIVRPSIVMPSWREPIRGWVDNYYGVTGVALAQATGMLRIMRLDKTKQVDLVPVDSCIGTMISAVWHQVTKQNSTKMNTDCLSNLTTTTTTTTTNEQLKRANCSDDELNIEEEENKNFIDPNSSITNDSHHHKVYHCTSGRHSKLLWRDAADNMFNTCSSTLQSGKLLRYPRTIYSSNSNYVKVLRFFSHTLVALLLDLVSAFMGQKKIFATNYKRLDESVNLLAHFTCNQWQFKTDNMEDLYQSLNDTDKRQLCSMDLSKMHWQSSWYDFSLSSRRFLLKKDLKGLPSDRRLVAKARMVDLSLRGISLLITGITFTSLMWGYPLSELTLMCPSEFICLITCILLSIMVWL